MVKRGISLVFLLIFFVSFLYGQDIVSAVRYMEIVSNHYSGIRDFEANVTIRQGNAESQGRLSYLQPSFLRIDFSRPAEQLIVFNGEALNIYVPDMRAILNQNLNRRAGTGTGSGLSMLRNNYTPSYFTSPYPEPLDAGSGERVIKLRLTRRSGSEAFREIVLSINPETRIIRRMEGRTTGDAEIRFDFTNVRVNVGIPEQRFVFDPPHGANMYQNFLFRVD